jgi:very-short-patch-repair endonuclease
MEDEDRAEAEGIPTASVERTLLDLAGSAQPRSLNNLIDRCERLGTLEIASLDSLLVRAGRHPGRARLARALGIYRDPAFSRARSERLLLALVKKARLPQPVINLFIAGHEIDAYWERERFAVEVDGWDAHRTQAAFESDPRRIEDLKLAGIDAIRITARRIEREPEMVAKRLATLLAQRRKVLDLDRF